jgi:hypothetical protein
MIDPQVLLHGEGNTIMYERHPELRAELFKLFSTAASPKSSAMSLKQLLCCLPQVLVPPSVTYNNIFRVIIMQFLDAHNFDVRSVKKTCVHIAHPDGRIIPFDTYNMFYRDGKDAHLKQLRGELDGSGGFGMSSPPPALEYKSPDAAREPIRKAFVFAGVAVALVAGPGVSFAGLGLGMLVMSNRNYDALVFWLISTMAGAALSLLLLVLGILRSRDRDGRRRGFGIGSLIGVGLNLLVVGLCFMGTAF